MNADNRTSGIHPSQPAEPNPVKRTRKKKLDTNIYFKLKILSMKEMADLDLHFASSPMGATLTRAGICILNTGFRTISLSGWHSDRDPDRKATEEI